jgi:misacylated tRNA(Ala) deacylase
MTEEIFRSDAYLKSCDANVISFTNNEVVLDKTVFYPEGGGQPGDRGVLHTSNGKLEVIDTRKDSDGNIHHLIDPSASLNDLGGTVTAELDWARRYHHMRTHTCLHLLCSIIPFPVTGGSISLEKGRLDFDMTETVDKQNVESQLQSLIDADYGVTFRWITDEEMQTKMDLVRTMSVTPPMGQGRVRLIDVDGIDLQPCGGTHVSRTGEIGAVRIGKVEKKGKHNRRINLHLDA